MNRNADLHHAGAAKRPGAPTSFDSPRSPPVDDRLRDAIHVACERACQSIAPAWPLDRAIAVNPHWHRVNRPLREVAARMAVLGGIQVYPPRDRVLEAWRNGRIRASDLDEARRRMEHATSVPSADQCIAALSAPESPVQLPLLIDLLDDDPKRTERLSWREAITHQVSQTCASYFDQDLADWQPGRDEGLYAFWRDSLVHDLGIGVLMGVPQLHRGLRALPHTREQAERWVLERLGLPESVWSDYLEAVLLTVNGWASWCAYLGWEARQQGRTDASLRDLLAIRLAWGAILLDCKSAASAAPAFAALTQHWRQAAQQIEQTAVEMTVDAVWQEAWDIAYQRSLSARLDATSRMQSRASHDTEEPPEVQAAFCIDVRSEPLRRAVESVWPAIQTIGFAGFFGLPIAYTPVGTAVRRPQLPGLLAPSVDTCDWVDAPEAADSSSDPGGAISQRATQRAIVERQQRFALSDAWRAATRWPASAFSYVEAAGAGYLGRLAGWLQPSTRARERLDLSGLGTRMRALCRPGLSGLDLTARVELARRILRSMGLDRGLAPLVLLIGHGSQSANNAHAAALDCGACCGQTGEVNARVLARLLNEDRVRQGLAAQGLPVPETTVFVAALHNTTTDELEYFDPDRIPPEARERLQRTQAVLAQAGNQVRRERAVSLGLDASASSGALLRAFQHRANDGAQTRPEWGLAGNAAFLIAPRRRSGGARLGGRCFLHDYEASKDLDGSLLELLMTAPMLVTHWINGQYHASVCDPLRLGSGNKVLHNVVGGRIGVFEGNGGDLRIGLPIQSVHDGQAWTHEPLRLTVVIDAPAQRIEQVMQRHAIVRDLVTNGWIHLWRWDGEALLAWRDGGWVSLGFSGFTRG